MPGNSITLRSRGGRNDSFRKRKSQRGEGQELEQEAQGSDCPVSLGRHESEVCVVRIPLKTLVAAEVGSRVGAPRGTRALWLPTRVAQGKPFLTTRARVGCCHLIRKAPGHFLAIMSQQLASHNEPCLVNCCSGVGVGSFTAFQAARESSPSLPPPDAGSAPDPAGSRQASRYSPRKGAQAVTAEPFALCWSPGLSLLLTCPGQLQLLLHELVGAGDKRVSLEQSWDTRRQGGCCISCCTLSLCHVRFSIYF